MTLTLNLTLREAFEIEQALEYAAERYDDQAKRVDDIQADPIACHPILEGDGAKYRAKASANRDLAKRVRLRSHKIAGVVDA